jgi:hypothetical protein
MTTKTSKSKYTLDARGNELHLQVIEKREHGYYHLYARLVTKQYDAGQWVPHGVDDDYADGLLWTGLRASCQGDDKTQLRASEAGESGPVYGFCVEYADTYSKLDERRVNRMAKTLKLAGKRLDALRETRGYVRSFGEYLGRVAEVLGCAGMVYQRQAHAEQMSGYRWDWLTVGEGVNRAKPDLSRRGVAKAAP